MSRRRQLAVLSVLVIAGASMALVPAIVPSPPYTSASRISRGTTRPRRSISASRVRYSLAPRRTSLPSRRVVREAGSTVTPRQDSWGVTRPWARCTRARSRASSSSLWNGLTR